MKRMPVRKRSISILPVLLQALLLTAWLAGAGKAGAGSVAHPAPSVLHDYIITLTPRLFTLVAYLRVSPELVPEVYRQIDTDGDGNTSPQERSAWVQNHVTTLRISLDDTELHTEYDLPPSLDRQTFLLSITQPVVVTYTARLDNTLQDKHRIRLVYGDNYLSYDEYYISVAGDPTNDPQPVNVSKQKYPATYQIVYHIPPVDSSGPLPSGRIAPPPFTGPQPSAGLSTQQGSGSLNSDNSQNIGTQPTALGAPGPLTSILENVAGAGIWVWLWAGLCWHWGWVHCMR
jgi:hypothetical protein